MPYTKEELKTLLKDLAREMDIGDLLVYYQVTKRTAVCTHEFSADALANSWVMLKPLPSPELTERIKLVIVEDTRSFHCNIETLNLISSVTAAQKANEVGCKEATSHRGDYMTECTYNNCHILEEGILYTAPADNLILPGIARAHLINNCKKLGIPVSEIPYILEELMHASEVLVTSSTESCLSANEVDKKPVSGEAPEFFERIQDAIQTKFVEQIDPHLDQYTSQ